MYYTSIFGVYYTSIFGVYYTSIFGVYCTSIFGVYCVSIFGLYCGCCCAGYTTGNNSLVISKMHHNRPLPQPPEEPEYVDIPKEHLDQFELGMRVKRLASTTSTFRPLWNPFTGQLTVRGAPDGNGVAEPALKILGHREAVPDDYDKEEVYNTFERIYHAVSV